MLTAANLPPAPEQGQRSWRSFLRQQPASTLACDLFTVETFGLRRINVLFFSSLATRRLEFIACTQTPTGRRSPSRLGISSSSWANRRRFGLLIHDRDTKCSRALDEIFRTEGIGVIRTPVRAPNANAFAERWVRTGRGDCLDRILIFGRRHLDRVLRVYTTHYTSTGRTARSSSPHRTAATVSLPIKLSMCPRSTDTTCSAG